MRTMARIAMDRASWGNAEVDGSPSRALMMATTKKNSPMPGSSRSATGRTPRGTQPTLTTDVAALQDTLIFAAPLTSASTEKSGRTVPKKYVVATVVDGYR